MNKNTRPTFTPEFRLESAKIVVNQDYSVREAAEAMGVGKSTMDKWIRKIHELENRIKRIELEKDILKRLPHS